jgi:hypothetical protein
MLGSEIKAQFMLHPVFRKNFLGVFGADQVRSIRLRDRTACVINTDLVNGDGVHWYCLIQLDGRLGKGSGH